ncbi:MAG: hypothetical protein OEZ10_11665 [Gammaproteobacteria bacterium]|nr:hypothetical protein [Gammaproteobacteria bacterium]
MNKLSWVLIGAVLLSACATKRVERSIEAYHEAAATVKPGDSREAVLSVLNPTQWRLPFDEKKQPEKYTRDGKLVEVHYFRARLIDDGKTTDDEFVPYTFVNDVLTEIGWRK